ncbi:MAG TPA: hypothetical protein VNC50_06215, partial [Planctomycetia bacterium]|nr:hypothetical protein [Planctomycetia bacterium]
AVSRDREAVLADYQAAAIVAEEAKDFNTAKLLYTRMRQLAPESFLSTYRLALFYEQEGKLPEARVLMRQLLPPAGPGVPEAHLWFARDLLKAPPSAEITRQIREHLARVHALSPGHSEAYGMQGTLELRYGNAEAAAEAFRRTLTTTPEYGLALARSYVLLERREDARRAALETIKAYETRLAARFDDHDARKRLAQAYTFLHEFERALRKLQEGLEISRDVEYEKEIAKVHLTWALVSDSVDDRWRRFEESFEHDATSPDLFQQLVSAAAAGEGVFLRAMLDRKRQVPQCRVEAALISALLDLAAQKPDLARLHLKLLGPEDRARAASSLSEFARRSKMHTGPALAWLEAALEVWPSEGMLRQTYGEALAAAGKLHESLAELRRALGDRSDDLWLHAALADVYGKLGLKERAAEHARKAEPLGLIGR